MPKKSKALKAVTLPQYQTSPAFMERFLDAIHKDGAEIERAKNTKGSIKLVDGSEIDADAFDYFFDNKSAMEEEFLHDLVSEIGSTKANWFCDVISNDWYDGKGLRDGKRVLDLKTSVKCALELIIKSPLTLSDIVENATLQSVQTMLSPLDIQKILTINKQMLIRHVERWKEAHPNTREMSDDDIFLRRGLSLNKPLNVSDLYKEWDYINSYSLAFSAPEKFAQMQDNKTPAILNGDIHLFDGRVLFFSPFIRKMKAGQLEAGIIPSPIPLPIRFQKEHGGILEYILGERPD
jgi:hypothetical protein